MRCVTREGTVQTCGDDCDVIRLRCSSAAAARVHLQTIPCMRLLCAAATRWEVANSNSRKRMHACARRIARVLIARVHAAAGARYRVYYNHTAARLHRSFVSVMRRFVSVMRRWLGRGMRNAQGNRRWQTRWQLGVGVS